MKKPIFIRPFFWEYPSKLMENYINRSNFRLKKSSIRSVQLTTS